MDDTTCGTTAGYRRHLQMGEQTCGECRAAHAADRRARYQRGRGCPDCGGERPYGRTKCDDCRTEYRVKPKARELTCSSCGETFSTSQPQARYCSRRCKERHSPGRKAIKERNKLKRALRWIAMQPYDEPIGPTLDDIGPIHGPAMPPASAVRAVTACCGFCGQPTGGPKWCDEVCSNIGTGRREPHTEITIGVCGCCGSLFVGRRPGRYCSDACSKKERRRRDKRKRRAAKRNARSEPYALREIAERDGWRCHLCGGKVPDRDYNARDRDPTIDHLVPVSEGGDDTKANVALAHNRCNWERGAKGAAQLRLTG